MQRKSTDVQHETDEQYHVLISFVTFDGKEAEVIMDRHETLSVVEKQEDVKIFEA